MVCFNYSFDNVILLCHNKFKRLTTSGENKMIDSMPESLKKLAKEMNVSESDLKCFADGVVSSLIKDKASETFMASNASDRIGITEAYVTNEGRKMEQFTTAYLTNTKAKTNFRKQILNLL